MFWTIVAEEVKRKRNGCTDFDLEPEVFKNPKWIDRGISIPGKITGIPILRPFKWRLRIKLNESKRINKKPIRKTLFVFTTSYWNVVDDIYNIGYYTEWFLHDLWYKLGEKYTEDRDHLIDSLEEKLKPFLDQIFDDYRETVEYSFLEENNDLRESETEKYDEMRKAQEEEQERQKRDYQRKSEEYQREQHEYVNTTGYGTQLSELEIELIKVGYRTLSKKFHPDTGGSTEKMQTLNAAKESLLKGEG